MKALILAGGLGTRISEETNNKPKPMVKIGQLTLLEHIMNIYSKSGIQEFIIATGYLHEVIEDYFQNYNRYNVIPFYTGEKTATGGRIKKVFEKFNEKTMCVTYGDGLSDIKISDVIDFHNNGEVLATVTAVKPQARFGRLEIENEYVTTFGEKLQDEEGWINGGFFILDRKISNYIKSDNESFEGNPLIALTRERQLRAFKHSGFWSPVDSLREKQEMELLWNSGKAPWTI
jgi:glucose-1-phosphate cytidylyltransferase